MFDSIWIFHFCFTWMEWMKIYGPLTAAVISGTQRRSMQNQVYKNSAITNSFNITLIGLEICIKSSLWLQSWWRDFPTVTNYRGICWQLIDFSKKKFMICTRTVTLSLQLLELFPFIKYTLYNSYKTSDKFPSFVAEK